MSRRTNQSRHRRDDVVTETDLMDPAHSLGDKWSHVGRALGLDSATLRRVQKDNILDDKEASYQMLLEWMRRTGRKATYGVLCDALRKEGRGDIADRILPEEKTPETVREAEDNIPEVSRSTYIRAGSEVAGTSDLKPTQKKRAAPPAVPFPRYKMDNDKRGKCLILTFEEFRDGDIVDTNWSRHGNGVDSENLENVFENLGFDVDNELNLNKENTMKKIKRMAKKRAFDSFVLFVCSHGNEKSFYTSDKEEIALQDVITPFNGDQSKDFFNKPKMFFFNSCRGKKKEEMAKADDAESHPENVGIASNISYYRPTQADFCVVLSTVPGFVSWRYLDSRMGSYFVRNLTTSLTENYNSHHLLDILTMSNNNLLRKFEETRESTGRSDSICQVPTIISTLTKAVYFTDQ